MSFVNRNTSDTNKFQYKNKQSNSIKLQLDNKRRHIGYKLDLGTGNRSRITAT